jgi:chloramphenicol-sensitive protein RarD
LNRTTLHGAYFALSAYTFWGVVPVYFKWVDHVSPWEILAQRVVWAVVLLLVILAYTGQLKALKIDLSHLPKLFLTAALLSINWLVYIYAVVDSNITETSLGYYINPLVSVFLGVLFLKEGLRPLQWIAIASATAGILVQLVLVESLPWMALSLAFSFGFYGLIRKNLNMHAIAGLAIETMIVAPFALLYIGWLAFEGSMAFGTDMSTSGLLMLGGFVTSFPLLCFAAAVTRLSLTAIGMFQYLSPSIALVLAVVYYGEPFDIYRAITFTCIWTAVALFSFEAWYHHKHVQFNKIKQ